MSGVLWKVYTRTAAAVTTLIASSNAVTSTTYTREKGLQMELAWVVIPLIAVKSVGYGLSWPVLFPYFLYRHFDGVPIPHKNIKNSGDIRWNLFLLGRNINPEYETRYARKLGLLTDN